MRLLGTLHSLLAVPLGQLVVRVDFVQQSSTQ